jgi:recombination protein RecR
MEYIYPLQRLIEKFASLKGVGKKTAERYAFNVMALSEEDANEFADAIREAKEKVKPCSVCGNYTDSELCPICSDDQRDQTVVCVVEDTKAVLAIEKTREFNGLYHVLGGVLSPSNGVGPDQIRLSELIERLEKRTIKELIIATNPDVDGETTALYISRQAQPFGVKTTRLAYGVPVGASLEYADQATLMRALDGRREI